MRSMRGSTSSANGFPLIFRLIFRFIFTQPSVAGGAPDSSGPVVYDSDEYFGEMQGGWASFACRAGGEGLGFCVQWCAIRGGCEIGRAKPLPLNIDELAWGGACGTLSFLSHGVEADRRLRTVPQPPNWVRRQRNPGSFPSPCAR